MTRSCSAWMVATTSPMRPVRGDDIALEQRVDHVVLVAPVRLTGELERLRSQLLQPLERGIDVGSLCCQLVHRVVECATSEALDATGVRVVKLQGSDRRSGGGSAPIVTTLEQAA